MSFEFFHATRRMSDADLERSVEAVRVARQAAREAVAIERQMHTATDGISARYAAEASRSGTDQLMRQLQLAGYSAAEARRRVERLR